VHRLATIFAPLRRQDRKIDSCEFTAVLLRTSVFVGIMENMFCNCDAGTRCAIRCLHFRNVYRIVCTSVNFCTAKPLDVRAGHPIAGLIHWIPASGYRSITGVSFGNHWIRILELSEGCSFRLHFLYSPTFCGLCPADSGY
jgi:hypothetical protein